MSDPFVAEIRIVPFNFAPNGWAFCNGQLMPISQNTALFSLVGTMYGGDGQSTFALPDLQGRAPMQPGQGPGLSLHDQGESGGSDTTALLVSEIPVHAHTLRGSSEEVDRRDPAGKYLAEGETAYRAAGSQVAMDSDAVSTTGGGQPHNNMQPFLTMNFIIALQGIFPQRP